MTREYEMCCSVMFELDEENECMVEVPCFNKAVPGLFPQYCPAHEAIFQVETSRDNLLLTMMMNEVKV